MSTHSTKRLLKIGFFNIFKDAFAIMKERAAVHKALRLLNKQEWSVEFLTSMLLKASKANNSQALEMTIVSPLGAKIIINTRDKQPPLELDDSIFNHLDDELRIKQFMDSLAAGT
jgi:hypothetical protein